MSHHSTLSHLLPHPAYFVTGIDTDIGKTIATGWLSRQLMAEGVNVITQKFIQTGCTHQSDDILTHRRIEGRPLTPEDHLHLTCPILYPGAYSPHLAAQLAGTAPNIAHGKQCLQQLQQRYQKVLVEGAGGPMVPITQGYLTYQLIQELQLPVILVTTAKLGSINHTLLALHLFQSHNIPVELIVYNTAIATSFTITNDTEHYLRTHTSMPLITLPHIPL